MNGYTVTLQHDRGLVAIHTTASNWVMALTIVLNHELAPVSAVVSVSEVSA